MKLKDALIQASKKHGYTESSLVGNQITYTPPVRIFKPRQRPQ